MSTAVEVWHPLDFSIPQKICIRAIASGASITTAAKAAGVSRSAVYKWTSREPAFREAIQEAYDAATDRVEEVAFELAVDAKHPRSVEFWLRNRRSERWNNERRSLTLEGDLAVRIEAETASLVSTALSRTLAKLSLPPEQQHAALRILRAELLAVEAEQAEAVGNEGP